MHGTGVRNNDWCLREVGRISPEFHLAGQAVGGVGHTLCATFPRPEQIQLYCRANFMNKAAAPVSSKFRNRHVCLQGMKSSVAIAQANQIRAAGNRQRFRRGNTQHSNACRGCRWHVVLVAFDDRASLQLKRAPAHLLQLHKWFQVTEVMTRFP